MKRSYSIILAIFFVEFFATVSIFAQAWQWQNPLPQGNRIRSIDAVDENNVWFGTSAGVVLHSDDGGAIWQLQQTPSVAYIHGIDFVDNQYGWAVGEEDFVNGISVQPVIFRTKNGGQSWERLQLPEGFTKHFSLKAVEFLDRRRGWTVGDASMVLYTEDGGQSWEPRRDFRNDFLREIRDLSVIDSTRLWIAGEYRLSYSNDGGLTWRRDTLDIGIKSFRQVQFVDENHGWLMIGGSDGIYRTVDGGQTWVVGNGNISAQISYLHFLSPDTGWVQADGIYFTSDGGKTWVRRSANTVGQFRFVSAQAGWGGGGGIGEYSIFRTTTGGNDWNELSSNVISAAISLQDVDFVDAQTGWVVGSGGLILSTVDGGQSWHRQQSNVNTRLTTVMFLNQNLGWTAGFTGTILRTRNGGETWQVLQEKPGTRNPHRAIFFVDSLNGWVAGGDVLEPGWIWHTTDGGDTWIDQTPGNVARVFDIQFFDSVNGWAVGSLGQIWHTFNGGTSWDLKSSPINANLVDVEFSSLTNGWISTGGENLLHTIDAGDTWEVIEVAKSPSVVGPLFFWDEQHGLAAGGLWFNFITEDGGKTWTRQPTGASLFIRAIDFVNQSQGWMAASGAILHTETGGVTSVEQQKPESEAISIFQFYPNYPNPFNPETRIRFEIYSLTANVLLTIHDVLGRKVAQIVSGHLQNGTHEVTWNGTNQDGRPVASGVYFARLRIGGQAQIRKMLLIR